MEQMIYAHLSNNQLLDTLISLTLIYFFLSLLTGLIVEILNHYARSRSSMLKETIVKMLHDEHNVNFGHLIYQHPMIVRMKENFHSLPQYISAQTFSQALIDVICQNSVGFTFKESAGNIIAIQNPRAENLFEDFHEAVEKLNHSPIKWMLQNMIARSSSKQIEEIQLQLQQWYNDTQDRAIGWYKSKIKFRVWFAAALVTLVLNVDSITLFRAIYTSDNIKATLVPLAEQLNTERKQLGDSLVLRQLKLNHDLNIDLDSNENKLAFNDLLVERKQLIAEKTTQIDSLYSLISLLGLPIGWQKEIPPLSWFSSSCKFPANCSKSENEVNCCYAEQHKESVGLIASFEKNKKYSFSNFFTYFLGIYITWISLLFGAPFWFQLMNRLLNIRNSGKIPSKTNESNK